MQEITRGDYPKRTEQNILDSYGIIITSHGGVLKGPAWTVKLANKHQKQRLHVDLGIRQAHDTRIKDIMGIFTYARVSTLDQNTDMQVNALKAAYPDAVLREEKKSGSTVKDRFVLNIILDMIGKGYKLVV